VTLGYPITANVAVIGQRGTGKTGLILAELASNPRFLYASPRGQLERWGWHGWPENVQGRCLPIPPWTTERILAHARKFRKAGVVVAYDEAQLQVATQSEQRRFGSLLGSLRNEGIGVWRTSHRPCSYLSNDEKSVLDYLLLFSLELDSDRDYIRNTYSFDPFDFLDSHPHWYFEYHARKWNPKPPVKLPEWWSP